MRESEGFEVNEENIRQNWSLWLIRNGKEVVSKKELIFDLFFFQLRNSRNDFLNFGFQANGGKESWLREKNDNDVGGMGTKHLLVSFYFDAPESKTFKKKICITKEREITFCSSRLIRLLTCCKSTFILSVIWTRCVSNDGSMFNLFVTSVIGGFYEE